MTSEDADSAVASAAAGGRSQAALPDQDLVRALRAGDRRALSKVITLLESTLPDHRVRAEALLEALLPHTGGAMRLAISGPPGVGKSTFIEAAGLAFIARGHRVAVLAVDPSSNVSGGSILGDKTRMDGLSTHSDAFVRPTPTSGVLGGVAGRTREALLACEAAGYDVVMVETVGVGQSEIAVAGMTDIFVLLQMPEMGDDLQGIKKGIMELADRIVITKADLGADAATRAEARMFSALRAISGPQLTPGATDRAQVRIIQVSALQGTGVDAFCAEMEEFHQQRCVSGAHRARRRAQSISWLWELVRMRIDEEFKQHPAVRAALPELLSEVEAARVSPAAASARLIEMFKFSGVQGSRPPRSSR